jgi:hypothetical protein
MLNIGRGHWGYCTTHRVGWFVGSNLYSNWRHETEEEQRARYDALDFGSYKDVEAYYGPVRPSRPLTAKELAAKELADTNIPF